MTIEEYCRQAKKSKPLVIHPAIVEVLEDCVSLLDDLIALHPPDSLRKYQMIHRIKSTLKQ